MKLPCGLEITAIGDTVGLSLKGPLSITSGYDDAVFLEKPYGEPLPNVAIVELADHMISRWQKVRRARMREINKNKM